MRKIITIPLIIFGAVLLKGCADLDETMRSGISSEAHFTTVDGLQALSSSMYLSIRMYYAYEAGQQITICGTDEFTYGQGRRGLWNDYTPALNGFITDPRSMEGIWDKFYEGINLTNSLIERADPEQIEGLSPERATRWIAEARFLRAHYYHLLVQHLGPVHLTLEETVGVETESSRTPEEEIWAVVIEDLEFAIANLPEVQEDYGRATANAARMNLAKVHLILENWQNAADLAIEVIDSGVHSLLDDYGAIFDVHNKQNEEIIWASPHRVDSQFNFPPGSGSHNTFGPRITGIPGISNPLWGGGGFRYKPTEFLVTEIFGNDPEIYDPNIENDVRYYSSFVEVYYFDDESALPEGAAIGDTAAYFPVHAKYQDLTDEEVAAKPYVFKRIRDWGIVYSATPMKKFRTPAPVNDNIPRDFIIYRLGETYLIAAEALMMLDKLDEAVNYFNEVRRRAEAPGQQIALIEPGELNVNEILNERSRELFGEYMRWKDLKRTGTLLERVRAHNERAAPNIQEFHLLRPIPESQIDRTTSEFPQNPGY